MKFEEILDLRTEKRLTAEDAANLLGVCSRSFRRYVHRYKESGIKGLSDKRLGKAAHNTVPVDEAMRLVDIYKTNYIGYSIAHFFDKYREYYEGCRSYNWVRKTLQKQGLVSKARKKGEHRRRRQRVPMIGMKIHQDASTHKWIKGEYWDLVVTLDDANSEIYSAFFVDEEGTWSSFRGVKDVIQKRGLFCSFYSDRGSHYWHTAKANGKVDKVNLTQFGKAMQQLGIEMIPAYSPQARGRSERMFGTLQKRLPLELKSAGITCMDEANRFLKEKFIPEFNKRFSVKPQEELSAFIPWQSTNILLDDILCIKEQRTVNKDNTVSYKGKKWQIPKNTIRYSYAKTKVRIHEYIDGSISIFHGPREIANFPYQEKKAEINKGCGLHGLVDNCFAITHALHKCPQPQQQATF